MLVSKVKFSQIEDRIDPEYYQTIYFQLLQKLKRSGWELKTIRELSEMPIASGATPKARGADYTTRDKGVPFIRIVDIKEGDIALSDVLYIKKKIHNGMLKRSQLKPHDILLSMAGTIGMATVVPEDIKDANINQALAKISLKKKIELKDGKKVPINPYYVTAYLNSPLGRTQTERLSRPGAQANINLTEINSIKIPIPPPKIQNEIGAHFKEGLELRKKAKENLEKAKQEVEEMIEGR